MENSTFHVATICRDKIGSTEVKNVFKEVLLRIYQASPIPRKRENTLPTMTRDYDSLTPIMIDLGYVSSLLFYLSWITKETT